MFGQTNGQLGFATGGRATDDDERGRDGSRMGENGEVIFSKVKCARLAGMGSFVIFSLEVQISYFFRAPIEESEDKIFT